MAADRDGLIYEGAAGPRAAGSDDQVSPDTHFRIMSMTKMVCHRRRAAADGAGQPRSRCADRHATARTFADVQVLDGFDGDTPRLRPPASRATVKQLITHTTGLGYWFWSADLATVGGGDRHAERAVGLQRHLHGADDRRPRHEVRVRDQHRLAGQGRRSGERRDARRRRQGRHHRTARDGRDRVRCRAAAQRADSDARSTSRARTERGWRPRSTSTRTPEYWAGGHGLHSTPRDYLRFQQALLHDGAFDGHDDPRAVDGRRRVHATRSESSTSPRRSRRPTPPRRYEFNLGPGYKFGYGLLLNTEDIPGHRRAWSGAWAGLCNTHFWVDRTAGITGAIYSQFLPFVPPAALQLYADFEAAIYASR